MPLTTTAPRISEQFLRDEFAYATQEHGASIPPGTVVRLHEDGGAEHAEHVRQAFHFLRTHDDGRYSSSTKMRILTAAERMAADPTVPAPLVLTILRPFTFDPETEVKSGGVLAVAVVWPDTNKVVMAVHRRFRRQRIGQVLLRLLLYPVVGGNLTTWVNQRNVTAQHFLLKMNWSVTSLNSSGGMCWAPNGFVAEDGVEDHMDPLSSGSRLAPQPLFYGDEPDYEDDDY